MIDMLDMIDMIRYQIWEDQESSERRDEHYCYVSASFIILIFIIRSKGIELCNLDPDSPSFASAYWVQEGRGESTSHASRLFKPLLFQHCCYCCCHYCIPPYLVTNDDDCRITVCVLYIALLECSCFHLKDSSAVMNPHGA